MVERFPTPHSPKSHHRRAKPLEVIITTFQVGMNYLPFGRGKKTTRYRRLHIDLAMEN